MNLPIVDKYEHPQGLFVNYLLQQKPSKRTIFVKYDKKPQNYHLQFPYIIYEVTTSTVQQEQQAKRVVRLMDIHFSSEECQKTSMGFKYKIYHMPLPNRIGDGFCLGTRKYFDNDEEAIFAELSMFWHFYFTVADKKLIKFYKNVFKNWQKNPEFSYLSDRHWIRTENHILLYM